ncbi:DoxX family protein [Paenibacillus sp. OV219]|uniref:DoxX family protein n=1 Tax=Paenibacillus sp. OV219 TaxID=1884377 RepID=UPI0008C9CD7E|nr:DoxX family protein [Paenibacillus sp. OV219]SEM72616.1 DoxX-like family protein [Paenibacillus sp. OV219]
MNIALWVIQGILALAFLMGGMMKAFQYTKVKASMPWAQDYSKGMVHFIGWSELLGAIGLIVPFATDVAPVLTSIAAIALAVIMVLAIGVHAKRKENQAIGMNVIFVVLLVIVAIGRW